MTYPWSSSGRNPSGRLRYQIKVPTAMAANTKSTSHQTRTRTRIDQAYAPAIGLYTKSNATVNQFRRFDLGLSQVAHWAGLSVMALIALMNAVAAMVRANWRYNCPVIPPRNAVG